MIAQRGIEVTVGYGLGAECVAELDHGSLDGLSARGVIHQVVSTPQSKPPARRTAVVLRDVLRSDRVLDVEMSTDPDSETTVGTPVKIDDVLLYGQDSGSKTEEPQDISLRVSEPYRGGASS